VVGGEFPGFAERGGKGAVHLRLLQSGVGEYGRRGRRLKVDSQGIILGIEFEENSRSTAPCFLPRTATKRALTMSFPHRRHLGDHLRELEDRGKGAGERINSGKDLTPCLQLS
jgi:hypothetical protein